MTTTRTRRALAFGSAVVAAVSVTLLVPAGPATAATPARTTTGKAQAVSGWLVRQLVDGSHLVQTFGGSSYADDGDTANLIWALAASRVGKTATGKALAYLASDVDNYTSVSQAGGTVGAYDGSVAKLALTAIVAGAKPTAFGGYNLLKALQRDECTAAGGSPTDYNTAYCPAAGSARNIYSSVSESLVMLAESRAPATYAPSSAATAYFLSLQCPNGGFSEDVTACTKNSDASVDETGYAAMALQALGTPYAAQLKRADAWLLSKRHTAGYWDVQGGPDVDSTGLAAAALAAAGKDVSTSRSWLAGQQVTTGPTVGKGARRGALKYQGTFNATSSVLASNDGVLGMVQHGSLATLRATGQSADAPVLALAAPKLGHHSVRVGKTQQVTGTGFAAKEKVTVELHSAAIRLGTARADPNGTVTLRFTVPSVARGRHTVELTGASGLSSSARFTVTVAAAKATAPPSSSHPSTVPASQPAPSSSAPLTTTTLADTGRDGRQTHAEVLVGVALVLLGSALAVLGRRRRHR